MNFAPNDTWTEKLNSAVAGVEFGSSKQKICQLKTSRIPNDREQDFSD
jgi:hypothetical protein